MNQDKPLAIHSRFRTFMLWLALVLAAFLIAIHLLQPDALTPITMVPTWAWLIPLTLVLVFGCRRTSRRLLLFASLACIAFAGSFVEEIRSYTRFKDQPVAKSSNVLRVVSLNCNVGQPNCAEEVIGYQPDIVLLQESPGREQLEQLARKLFGDDGHVIASLDASIIARGTLRAKFEPAKDDRGRAHFVSADISIDGDSIRVVSTRLTAPVFRLDFWRSAFWSEHVESRVSHRTQLGKIAAHVADQPDYRMLIVGGDFNSVARDGALKALNSRELNHQERNDRLVDSFAIAGLGWGASGTNKFPLFRVDQIWSNRALTTSTMTTRKTEHSDHRMVVADFEMSANRTPVPERSDE